MIGVIEGESVPRVFIPKLVEFFKAGKFHFDRLVTFYNFDQINQAFEDSANGTAIKPILRIADTFRNIRGRRCEVRSFYRYPGRCPSGPEPECCSGPMRV